MKTFVTTMLLALAATAAHAQAPTLTAPASPAKAQRFALALNLDATWPGDDGYRLYDANQMLGAGGLSLAWDAFRADKRLVVAPFVEWQGERAEGAWMRDGDASLEAHNVAVGVRPRFHVRPWLAPFVRLGGGVTFAQTALELASAPGRLTADSRSYFVRAGAGVELRSRAAALGPNLPKVALSISVEGGYLLATALELDLTLDGARPGIPTGSVPLGELERSRPYGRVGIALHF